MGGDDLGEDIELMREFNNFCQEYSTHPLLDVVEPDICLQEIRNNIDSLIQEASDEDCLRYSYQIYNYCFWLQTELNQIQVKINWCEDSLNRILAQEYNNFDKFMRHEIRRQAICLDNSFAFKVEKLRSRLKARLTILENRLIDLRHMANVLQELGKRKGFNR